MLKGSTTLIVLFGALLVGLVAAKEEEVFVPDDCDVLTIKGKGFNIKFEQLQQQFAEVKTESASIEVPRDDESESGVNENKEGDNGQNQKPKERVVTNENLREKTKKEKNSPKNYGNVDADLMRWIKTRAAYLANRIQRYNNELSGASNGNRIVLDILLLNTLVDLDNLVEEKIPDLIWLKNKLNVLLSENIHKEARLGEVREFVKTLIAKNNQIERSMRGKNNPGEAWMTNTQAIKRVLHEQRFSESLGQIIVEYLGGTFSMMMRSIVYSDGKPAKKLNDGLFYAKAKGRVPADFPFSSQDAISHGDF